MISTGFPEKRNQTEPAHLREFWEVRSRLSNLDGVALMDKRIVIPKSLRKVVLSNLHSANQGTTGIKFRGNQCVYWPGMDASIRNHRETCLDCIKNAPSQQKEPLVLTPRHHSHLRKFAQTTSLLKTNPIWQLLTVLVAGCHYMLSSLTKPIT